jgi:hypothetical protein
MPHIVLLGDSILDNAAYVPGRPAVIDQLRSRIGRDWQATLLAVDGAVCVDVVDQLAHLPDDVTHLCLSAGGNDALLVSGILHDAGSSAVDGFARLADVQRQFRADYERLLAEIVALSLPTVVCTIYDAIPELDARELTGLSVFNDVITTCAFSHGLPIIELRCVCGDREDYSSISPIEPSEIGGGKIVRAIQDVLLTHDFSTARSTVFAERY